MKDKEYRPLALDEIDRQELKNAIKLVNGIKEIEWSDPHTGQFDDNGKEILQFSFPLYPPGLYDVLDIAGVDFNYGENYENNCKGVPIEEMDLPQIRTMLTRMQRGERFCDGFIEDEIKNGNLPALLRRLDELFDIENDKIRIVIADIATMDTDCVVNAANEGLQMGSGVCGAIFNAAGPHRLQAACDKIGGCPTGSAVITQGFKLKAKYIIHAVGPRWHSHGNDNNRKLLRRCYIESLDRAKENNCHSIAFSLISSGVFGCPIDQAWEQAIKGCCEWIDENPDYDIKIFFTVRKPTIKEIGDKMLHEYER